MEDDEVHLARYTFDGYMVPGSGLCCWIDEDGSWWRIDMSDGVAVTWCPRGIEKPEATDE